MAEIFPFHAYRYNLERVRLCDVVTQPYDKITPAMQQRYAESNPYNLVTVEKGLPRPGDSPDDNVYTRAAAALEEWIRSGILVRDSAPSMYAYFQEYTAPGTAERRTRKGFIALGRVEDYAAGIVFRHEATLSGPKADRLELLRRTQTQTGQLFMLYTDPHRRVDAILDEVAREASPVEVRDEYDVVHRLWPITDPARIAELVRQMESHRLVIADGHHRYETALNYRDERRAQAPPELRGDRNAPYEKAMMTFFNTRSEGWTILPTHRVIRNLSGFDAGAFLERVSSVFRHTAFSFGSPAARSAALERFRSELAARGASGHAIGMYAGSSFDLLVLPPDANLAALLPDVPPAQRELDVVLLHRLLLEKGLGITPAAVAAEQNIVYEREMTAALEAVDRGEAQVCFLLNPVDVERVAAVALAGEVLPQKSTDFYPKLLSGLTLYRME